jgi:hypothetical protein
MRQSTVQHYSTLPLETRCRIQCSSRKLFSKNKMFVKKYLQYLLLFCAGFFTSKSGLTVCKAHLKGQSQIRDVRPLFFSRQTIPLGPLIHGLKRFRIQIRIRRNIWLRKSLNFNLILVPWGRQDHLFCYTVALTASTKAETIVFWFRTI